MNLNSILFSPGVAVLLLGVLAVLAAVPHDAELLGHVAVGEAQVAPGPPDRALSLREKERER